MSGDKFSVNTGLLMWL